MFSRDLFAKFKLCSSFLRKSLFHSEETGTKFEFCPTWLVSPKYFSMFTLRMHSITIVRSDEDNDEDELINPTNPPVIPNLPILSDICINKPSISQAFYGHGDRAIDVTHIVQKIESPYFQATNALFTDPCPGIVKTLTLFFSDGQYRVYPEGSTIETATRDIDPHIDHKIIRATYGWQKQVIDVTTIVQCQTHDFVVSNTLFTDPCVGKVKTLTVQLDVGILTYVEHSHVDPNAWHAPQVMRLCL